MLSLRSTTLGLLSGLLLLAAASQAFAQGGGQQQPPCGITGVANGVQPIVIDPFAPAGTQNQQITLVLTSKLGNGNGAKTQTVNFVLTEPVDSGIEIRDSNNANILYTAGQTGGRPTINSQAAGEINWNFGGNTTVSTPIPLTISFPPNTNLTAGGNISFDILYVCKGTGGMGDVDIPTQQTGAITINVTIRSALQAFYSGQPLDFGEISTVSDAQASTVTTATANINVRSSGPYTVAIPSTTNAFRMRHATLNDYIGYQLNFLGQTPSNTSPSFTTRSCTFAGVVGGTSIPVSATLRQGGVGHAVGSYADQVTVVITPLAAGASAPGPCP